jgi:hypothetical protein
MSSTFLRLTSKKTNMKKILLCTGVIVLTGLFTGCVPITYTKSVTVHKDASGKVTEIIEYEGITEAHSEMKKIQEVGSGSFDHLNKN